MSVSESSSSSRIVTARLARRAKTPLQGMIAGLERLGHPLDDFIKTQISQGAIRSPTELMAALSQSRAVPEERLWQGLADGLELPFVDIDWIQVDPALLSVIPIEFCIRHRCLPLRRIEGIIELAVANPYDASLAVDLQHSTGLQIIRLLCQPTQLDRYLLVASVNRELLQESIDGLDRSALEDLARNGAARDGTSGIAVLFQRLVLLALQARASDIHLEPLDDGTRVRFRIDGNLQEQCLVDRLTGKALTNYLKVAASLDIAEQRVPQDGRVSVEAGSATIDLRLSTLPTIRGEKCVARLMDQRRVMLDLGALSFTRRVLKPFTQLLHQPNGILFITGPTGSGKTTTLYAALSQIASPTLNITTIEDPVEYRLGGINQVQMNGKAGMTFARALRSILRQDPDVVLVGEIRDQETAETALQAAITGHLVLATLHTNTAPEVVIRLEDLGVPRWLIAQALRGSLGQRLVRRLCPACRRPHPLTPEQRRLVGLPADGPEIGYASVGCPACDRSGFVGRIPVHELLLVTDPVADAISNGTTTSDWMPEAYRAGYRPLLHDGLVKALAGMTTVDEIIAISHTLEPS